MRIRRISSSDIGDVVKIIHKIMGPGDAKAVLADLKDTLEGKNNSTFKIENFYVVEVSKKIVAGGGVWALKHDPYIARLDWFFVDPDFQRKGIGTMLLGFLENYLKKRKIKLILAETSSGKNYRTATKFWAKLGFKEAAKIANYWEDGSACLIYVKRI